MEKCIEISINQSKVAQTWSKIKRSIIPRPLRERMLFGASRSLRVPEKQVRGIATSVHLLLSITGIQKAPLTPALSRKGRGSARRFFSHFTFHISRPFASRAVAFTLAEVLITLGIIGIVAAMSIPTLITEHQKQTAVTQLKENFRIFSEAFQNVQTELGPSQSWTLPTSANITGWNAWWETYYIPNSGLSIIKTCTGTTTNECWATNGTYLDGTALSIEDAYKYYVLKNGSSFVLGWFTYGSNTLAIIIVDLNGLKNPNVVGKDIFQFQLNLTKNLVQFPYRGEGSRISLRSVGDYACSKTVLATGGRGYNCGTLIQMDSWQILNDYPW